MFEWIKRWWWLRHYRKVFEKFHRTFVSFGEELGYSLWFYDKHSYFASTYLRKEHALQLYVEYPDSYINIFVVRLENGEIPKDGYYADPEGRQIRISVSEIYDVQQPAYPGKNPRSWEALSFYLQHDLNMIRENPTPLLDYVAHMEENTSVQKTKEQMRKSIQEAIENNEKDYRSGKLDKEIYELVREDLLARLVHWQ